MREKRPLLNDPAVLGALAHPVRLDVLGYLMSAGPATASECARAIGDSPSNCSYHLRVLAGHGLVESAPSEDGRERPWRATITGFDTASPDQGDDPSARALVEASIQLDHHLAREYLRNRDQLDEHWRDVDAHANYGLRVTPEELRGILARIDQIVRPYIAATRGDAPEGTAVASVSVLAFPRPGFR